MLSFKLTFRKGVLVEEIWISINAENNPWHLLTGASLKTTMENDLTLDQRKGTTLFDGRWHIPRHTEVFVVGEIMYEEVPFKENASSKVLNKSDENESNYRKKILLAAFHWWKGKKNTWRILPSFTNWFESILVTCITSYWVQCNALKFTFYL